MKFLIKLLYFLLFILAVVLLAGILLPKNAEVRSSINISAPIDIVFDQVNDFRNWESWSPWLKSDSTLVFKYGEQTAGAGASYSWTSEKSGTGNQTMEKCNPKQFLQANIDFGNQGDATGNWSFKESEKSTSVIWEYKFTDMVYFERYFMFLFKDKILSDLNFGLQNLKSVSEELRLSRISDVAIKNLEIQPAMAIIDSSEVDGMGRKMSAMFNKLSKYLEKRKLKPTGPPFTVYYSWNPEGLTKFACGIPIEKRTWGWKQYTYLELPEGQAAVITHWGTYGSEKPWLALDKYLKDNNLQLSGAPWEIYLSDPNTEPDTSKWELQVFYPVQ